VREDMKRPARIAVVVGALLAASSGCGGDDEPYCFDCYEGTAWAYPETRMVVGKLYLPQTSADARSYAFDLDHNGTVDNQLGNILVALESSMGASDPQHSVDDAMGRGSVIVLFSVYAETMQDSANAILWAFLGDAITPPWDPPHGPPAGDSFTVDTVNGPVDAYFGGKIRGGGGMFGGDAATLAINLPLTTGSSLELELKAVHIEFDISSSCSATTCELTYGKLGGAITENDLNTKVLPAVTSLLQDQLSGRCSTETGSCVCESGSGAETVQGIFDTNGDCTVTLDEIQNNNTIKEFLKGDVTLKDGTKALSLAVGFDAVNAVFQHPDPPR
jgi:hypothetical protein